MLDQGFAPQINQILKTIPKKRQTLLFSATLPREVLKLSENYLTNPERISVGSTTTPIAKIKLNPVKNPNTRYSIKGLNYSALAVNVFISKIFSEFPVIYFLSVSGSVLSQ